MKSNRLKRLEMPLAQGPAAWEAAMAKSSSDKSKSNGGGLKLRSQAWFDNPDDPGMSALYLERYLNYGLKREELQSGKPIIGIAQTGSDLSPCNRHHLQLAHRVREGIREAGGIAFEFPMHPIQETGKRPNAALDRNLAYLGLVEVLYGYPIDGVVLMTGCDKTTPACIMAAATVNIPAIVLSGGPMLNGWYRGERSGSGTIAWKARELYAAGEVAGMAGGHINGKAGLEGTMLGPSIFSGRVAGGWAAHEAGFGPGFVGRANRPE
jgi:dihydroxy-acid dehydratase